MADAVTTEASEIVTNMKADKTSNQDMVIEASNASLEQKSSEEVVNGVETKRAREEGAEDKDESGGGKKQKTEESTDGLKNQTGPVSIGPKSFSTSVEMFDYFYKFLHYWPVDLKVNKYEHNVLLELIKKGHPEPEKKIGVGISAFQVRSHPKYKSRCFFIIRRDGSDDDFSFRKCVDNILPLPESMKVKQDVNKILGGGGSRGGRGCNRGGRGRGGGKGRN